MSKKILFISQYFYPENFKGNDIVFDFIKRGYEITVLTGKPNYPIGRFYRGYNFFNKRNEVIGGAKIIRVPLIPRGSGRGILLVLNYISFIVFSYWAVLFRLKNKYDAIFVQQLSPVTMALPGLWMKKRQNIPLFLWVLDLWPESLIANSKIKKGYVVNYIDKLVQKIYNNSDVILTSSRLFKGSVLNKCKDKNKKIVYFPNWAEDVFLGEKKSYRVPEFPVGFNIMFAGNIGDSQGFEAILEAAKSTGNRNVNWILVGEGRKVNWIKDEIKNRQINNVYLMGGHSINAMPSFFKEADAMLVSLKNEPIFALTVPAKIQAYMASGKIILGMLNGEGKDLINESGAGFAVGAEEPDLLVEKVLELLQISEEEKRKMEKKALEYYMNNFSKEKLFEKLDTIFNS